MIDDYIIIHNKNKINFSQEIKQNLLLYLKQRNDSNNALFVSESPYNRLSKELYKEAYKV